MTKKDSFSAIAAEAATLVDKNTSTDWGAVAINALVLPFLLTPIMSVEDKSKLKTTAIGDEWLAVVAGLPVVSRAGLALLANALERKGWVSVDEAAEFIRIESEAQQLASEQAKAEQTSARPGASMLLARAEKELPGAIRRFAEGTKDFVDAAGGVLAFTAEKAVWVGRGLGALAGLMKELRTGK